MFRKMRNADQQVPRDEAFRMLERCSYGVAGLQGDEGYPYTVPVNHVVMDGKIYFHGACEGYKADAAAGCSKVSFCAVDRADIVPEKFNCLYSSVVVFGRIRAVEDRDLKKKALEKLVSRYSAGYEEAGGRYIDSAFDEVRVFEITPEHVTGKAGKL